MTDWDLRKYYWPKERVLRWWAQGWDWDSLQKKPCPHPDFNTYADYYSEAFSRTVLFDDPRPGKTGRISEWDYWHLDDKDRWLTEFAGKRWTPYHLPLYDIDGNLSPKHPDYKGAGKWEPADYEAFTRGLITRLKEGSNQRKSPLTGIVTPPQTSLSGCDETLYPVFSDSLWGDNPRFNEVSFGDWANFSDAAFGGSADFSNATFGDRANFSDATFGDRANFSDATFGYSADFSNATFDGIAVFYNATFGNRANFSDATLGFGAIFDKATFDDIAVFNNATFGDRTIFEGTKFRAKVFFEIGENIKKEERSFRNISFVLAEFCDTADFTGRRFTKETDFSGATFHGPAKFYEAELPEETYFTYQDANWPLPSRPQKRVEENGNWLCRLFNGRVRKPSYYALSIEKTLSTRFEEYEKAFCRLKKIQQGHEARTTEHFFYKLELKARMRRSDIRWTEKFAAGAYGLFSDYGESISRPFWCWLFLNALTFAGLIWLSALSGLDALSSCTGHQAIIFLLRNLMPGAWLRDLTYIPEANANAYQYWIDQLLGTHPYAFYGLAIGHEVITIILAFLFGLALKRRFQIK